MRQLADLDLRYTRVTQGGIDTLRAGMPKLRVEFIATQAKRAGVAGAPAMSGKGEKALAGWVEAMGGRAKFVQDRLTGISLANTAVTDQQLVNLREAPALQTLSLETTQIGDLGCKQLAALGSLVELNLNQTTTSDTGLAALAGLKNLHKLSLNHTLVRGPGLAALSHTTGQLSGYGTRRRRHF